VKAWLVTVMFKANHRDTEDTEEMSFFPGRETTAREKCLRLRRTPLEQKPESPDLGLECKEPARRAAFFCPIAVSRSGKNKLRSVHSVPLW
jgi:hypothetical protein